MTKEIKLGSKQANFIASSAAWHAFFQSGLLVVARMDGEDWAVNYDAMDAQIRSVVGDEGYTFEEKKELAERFMDIYGAGFIPPGFFSMWLEEVGDQQEVLYEGMGPDDESGNPTELKMYLKIPSAYRFLAPVERKRKDGTKETIVVDLTERPHLTEKQNEGKAIRCEYWYDKFEAMKRETMWNRLFEVSNGDFIGVEGIRRSVQRAASLVKNIKKQSTHIMNLGNDAKKHKQQVKLSIQKKERQLQRNVVQQIRLSMDEHIAREHWELFLNETLTAEEKQELRRSLDVDRFDATSKPISYQDKKPGENGVYCAMYARLHAWCFGEDGKGMQERDMEELLNIASDIRNKPWGVQLHVTFTSAVNKQLRKELGNLYEDREWNEVSEDPASVSGMAAERAKENEAMISAGALQMQELQEQIAARKKAKEAATQA
jgi:hypothetical protein